ncbi:MAG: HAMP domain-containing histidine kinase [Firmicutes bacterium]|nr:HAMP domain-containing histidine kinase [Bacillota bacterium]
MKPELILTILVVLLAALIVLLLLERRKREKAVKELIEYLTRVQDITSLPEIREMTEQSTGILQSEIYKVVSLLKEAYSSEHQQKKYMADMMSDISHQLKTPLTAVSIMSELLMAPGVSEEQRLEYASRIQQQVDKMTWLIRTLLTLSQLEAGTLEMKKEPIPLEQIIKSIRESLDVMADTSEVSLEAKVPDGLEVAVDRHWFREALSNIIKNCIEHTASGGYVRISASQTNLSTTITIEDNGEGIRPEDLPHIFERFYKAKHTASEAPAVAGNAYSVGIGLAMAKQIIQNHDGTIEAASEVGKGTVFTIKLFS